jgi:hypothetical protein
MEILTELPWCTQASILEFASAELQVPWRAGLQATASSSLEKFIMLAASAHQVQNPHLSFSEDSQLSAGHSHVHYAQLWSGWFA